MSFFPVMKYNSGFVFSKNAKATFDQQRPDFIEVLLLTFVSWEYEELCSSYD